MGEGQVDDKAIEEIKNFKGFLGLNYEDRRRIGWAFVVVNLLILLASIYYFQELRVVINKMAYPQLFEKYEECAKSGHPIVIECAGPFSFLALANNASFRYT